MKRIVILIYLFLFANTAYSACEQTLSVGGNIASAVANAAPNTEVCLNAGNYGVVNLFDIGRSTFVTLKSTSGQTANISPQPGNSDFIRFQNLTISSNVVQNSCSSNIQWVNNNFASVGIVLTNSGCPQLNTLFDGNTFSGYAPGGGYEGRLQLVFAGGITVTNNLFIGGTGDGIQLTGGVNNVNINNNTFTDIIDVFCRPVHCDAIQLFGTGNGIVIQDNLFKNGDTFIMAPDGSDNVLITNNVFNGTGITYPDKIQFGSSNNHIFDHNTLIEVRASFDSKLGEPASTNAILRHNLMAGGSTFKLNGGGGCTGCTQTNNLSGTPTFVGGANPSTFSGFKLTSSSIGYQQAPGPLDIGINDTSGPDVTPPTVSGTVPSSSATGVSISANQTITFNEALDPATVSSSTFILTNTSTSAVIPSAVTHSSGTVTINPNANLSPSTQYTITVRGGSTDPRVRDVAGNNLAANYTFNFTTVVPDTTPPTVSSTVPASGATSVSVNADQSITFSETMDSASINSTNIVLTNTSTSAVIPTTITYSGNTATINPNADLAAFTGYTITLPSGGVRDVSLNGIAATFTRSFTTGDVPQFNCSTGTNSLWPTNPTPATTDASDGVTLELGVKFRSSTSGVICGVRFYKGVTNTGTHVGKLYTSTGTLLASVTFTGETTSGWQRMDFSSPVDVTANTTYIASYVSPSGAFSTSAGYFNSSQTTGNLYAFTGAESGGNGVYRSGAAGFPNTNGNNANYWVDVVYSNGTPSSDTTPPTVNNVSPANATTGIAISSAVTATFSEAMNATTLTTTNVELRNPANSLIPATVSYNSGNNSVVLTPSAPLSNSTVYTVRIKSGGTGVKDVAGNALATDFVSTFTTAPLATCPCTVWDASATPQGQVTDATAIELGVRFRSSIAGNVTGIRFYKGTANTGTHVGKLWSNVGNLLANATFTGETASGWQQVTFSAPVAIAANTTYVASYFAPNGNYSVDSAYFSTQNYINTPLTALQTGVDGSNGVFLQSPTGGFPTSTNNAGNYWVAPVFDNGAPTDTTPPTVTSTIPVNVATGVGVGANLSVLFDEQLDPLTVTSSTIVLTATVGGAVIPATVTYSGTTATINPNSDLSINTQYTVTVRGGGTDPRVKDDSGNALAANYTFTFTTQTTTVYAIPLGAVNRWNFETASFLADSIGTSAFSSTSNMPVVQVGKHGDAAYFDGADFITAALTPSNFNSAGYSFSFWVNPDAETLDNTRLSATESLPSLEMILFNRYIFEAQQQRNIGTRYSSAVVFNNTKGPYRTTLQAGQWSHVVVTYGSNEQKLYVNGNLAASIKRTKPMVSQFNRLTLGSSSRGKRLKAKLDTLIIYPRALTQAEVTVLNNQNGQ